MTFGLNVLFHVGTTIKPEIPPLYCYLSYVGWIFYLLSKFCQRFCGKQLLYCILSYLSSTVRFKAFDLQYDISDTNKTIKVRYVY